MVRPRDEAVPAPPPGWWQEAACFGMDPDVFYEEQAYTDPEVKAACGRCVVRGACLLEALANKEDGVWGGTSQRTRASLRKHLTGVDWSTVDDPAAYVASLVEPFTRHRSSPQENAA